MHVLLLCHFLFLFVRFWGGLKLCKMEENAEYKTYLSVMAAARKRAHVMLLTGIPPRAAPRLAARRA